MAGVTKVRDFERLSLVEKRLGLLVGARFIDRGRLLETAAKMDKIRQKMTAKAKGFDATKELRKWRDKQWRF